VTATTKPISDDVLQTAARVIKCLGHPLRLRLLEIMERGGEQNVSELQSYSGATQAAVSEQLGILRGHGVVESRRDGTYMLYRIIEPKVFRILACVRECEIIDGRIA
jgi:DNA-binding transcriptional ArsR family regulator